MKRKDVTMNNLNIFGKLTGQITKRVKLMFLLIMLLLMLGSTAYNSMHREDLPEVALKSINVSVAYPGAAPNEVDEQIVEILEPALRSVGGIQNYTAESSENHASILLDFNMKVDIDKKLKEVESAIDTVKGDLPSSAKEPSSRVIELKQKTALIVYLSGPQSMESLQNLAEDMKDDIEDITGVEKVSVFGGINEQVVIEYDPVKMQLNQIPFSNFESIIEGVYTTIPLGSKEIGNKNTRIRVTSAEASLVDIMNIEIATPNGNVYLSDVADVYVEKEYQYGENYISLKLLNDSTSTHMAEALKIVVYAADGADISKVAEASREYVNEKSISLKSSKTDLVIFKDRGEEVEFKLNEVQDNALAGLAVVIAVLFIFIGFQESIIAAAAIPISLLMSIIVMNALNMTFNTVSMSALIISLGMLVDSTIVVIENIVDKLNEGHSIDDGILEGTNEVALAVFAATMTTVSAFIPLLQPAGILGEFIKVLPQTVIIAILSSFITSVMFTPALCKAFIRRRIGETKEPTTVMKYISVLLVFGLSVYAFRVAGKMTLVTVIATSLFSFAMYQKMFGGKNSKGNGIKYYYAKFMERLLNSRSKRVVVLLIAFVVLLGSVNLVRTNRLQIQMLPNSDETNFVVSIELAAGELRSSMLETIKEVDAIFAANDGVDSYVFDLNSDIENFASGRLKLVSKDNRDLHSTKVIDAITSELMSVAGADFTIEVATASPQNSATVDVKLESNSRAELIKVFEAYSVAVRNVDGIQTVTSDYTGGTQEAQIEMNSKKIKALGLSENNISHLIKKI